MSSKVILRALLFCVIVRFSIPAWADRPTTLTVTPASGTYGGTATLQATLNTGNRPISNQSINFALNGTGVGTATTNPRGIAILNNVNLAGLNAKTYINAITAVFVAADNLRGSAGTATLIVNPAPASVTPNVVSKVYGPSNP